MRAKNFYEMLKVRDDNTMTICFDCQQSQPHPKLGVGEIFINVRCGFITEQFLLLRKIISLKMFLTIHG